MKVTLKSNFIIHDIADEKVLIKLEEQIDFTQMLMLNETAAYIIKILQKQSSITTEELVLQIIEQYDVSQQEAYCDIEKLLCQLAQEGAITIE